MVFPCFFLLKTAFNKGAKEIGTNNYANTNSIMFRTLSESFLLTSIRIISETSIAHVIHFHICTSNFQTNLQHSRPSVDSISSGKPMDHSGVNYWSYRWTATSPTHFHHNVLYTATWRHRISNVIRFPHQGGI